MKLLLLRSHVLATGSHEPQTENMQKRRPDRGSNTGPHDLQSYALPLSYRVTALPPKSIHLYQCNAHHKRLTRRVVDAYLFYSNMADVEMKDAKSKADAKDDVATPPLSPVSEIKSNVTLIERAVSTLEPRFTIRVLRSLTALRKRLDDKALCDAISEVYPQGT